MEVKYEELKVGNIVKNDDGEVCIVTAIFNIHNIQVEGRGEWEGLQALHCLDPECHNYDPLFKIA